MWGCHISQIKDGQNNDIIIVFRPPSVEDKNCSHFIYDNEFQKAVAYNIPTEKKLIEIAKANGMWSEYEDSYINKYDEIMEYAKKQLSESISVVGKKNIEKQIKQSEEIREKIQKKYQDIVSKSAEAIAREATVVYLISKTTYYFNTNKLLFDNINNTTDEFLLWNVVKAFLDTNKILDATLIRRVARSSPWRVRWNVGKENVATIFGSEVQNLSETQLHLVYWSQIYDSVYQSMECPPDEVIEDNNKLDVWIKEQSEKRNTEKINRDLDKKSASKGFYDKNGKFHSYGTSVEDHHENFEVVQGYFDRNGYWRDYTPEEKKARIKQIYSRNSTVARTILAKEQNTIESRGTVTDGKLRNERTYMLLGRQTPK